MNYRHKKIDPRCSEHPGSIGNQIRIEVVTGIKNHHDYTTSMPKSQGGLIK